MGANPHTSLIFVNYQSAHCLEQALRSLFACEDKDFFEIIVVNNDVSEQEDLERMRKIFSFTLVENEGNKGFGHGGNKGAEKAAAPLFGFINPDTLWQHTCLFAIENIFRTKKEVGVLGMALTDTKGRPELWSAGAAPTLGTLFLSNILGLPKRAAWEVPDLSYPDWVSGGALFIRADLFAHLGGFDESFFLYFEDVDLCARAREHGFLIARHADFPVVHLGAQSRASLKQQKQHFYESQKYYFAKHRPYWEVAALKFFHCLFPFLR